LLWASYIPCPALGPVHHPRENILKDPQLLANGTIITDTHPVVGLMRFPKPAARFDVPFRIRHHAPMIGEHTAEILFEIGYGENEITRLNETKAIRSDPGLH